MKVINYLFIVYGLILGSIFAYSLSLKGNLKDKEKEEVSDSLKFIVGSNLKNQKKLISKLHQFVLGTHLLYGIPSLFLFNFDPWMLGLSLIFIGLVLWDYFKNRGQLKQVKVTSRLLEIREMSRSHTFICLIIIAIQIGLLI